MAAKSSDKSVKICLIRVIRVSIFRYPINVLKITLQVLPLGEGLQIAAYSLGVGMVWA
jgi:hypothetical protein